MSGEIVLCVVGNITADPELRYTPGGKAVANLTIASTPRVYKDGTWTDGEPTFVRANIWGTPAENAAESLTRGDRVVATGKLQQRSYETNQGDKRTVYELLVDDIGVSLKFHPAKTTRAARAKPERGRPDHDEPPF